MKFVQIDGELYVSARSIHGSPIYRGGLTVSGDGWGYSQQDGWTANQNVPVACLVRAPAEVVKYAAPITEINVKSIDEMAEQAFPNLGGKVDDRWREAYRIANLRIALRAGK